MWFKKLRLYFSSKRSFAELFEIHSTSEKESNDEDHIEFLADLVKVFRPLNARSEERISIHELIDYLSSHPTEKEHLRAILQKTVGKKEFYRILTDYGIVQNKPFRKELVRRLFAKLIPDQFEKNTLEYVLAQVFPFRSDIEWIQKIPKEELIQLCRVLDLNGLYQSFENNDPIHEMLKAMNLIAQRISGQVLDSDVIRMVPELAELDSPFKALEAELSIIEHRFLRERNLHFEQNDLDIRQLQILHKQCTAFIDRAFRNSSKYGITLSLNQRLLKIRQELSRFEVLMDFLILSDKTKALDRSIDFGIRLLKYHCLKNTVSKLINDSTQSIAYEITQHTARTGEHYITSGYKDYFKMLYSAMGGGLVVGFLCIIKLLLAKVDVSDFGHAFLYSMNYSLGFIAIYLFSFTLATKQPAMTASTLIRSIEKGMNKQVDNKFKHQDFAALFARLFRSQFIAFTGNVILAFPVALGLIYLIDLFTAVNIAESKHEKLIEDLSPVHSPAIFHSAIAGVFLFLSGLIAGGIANRNKHMNLAYRIEEHPALKTILGRSKTKRVAIWIDKKWPGVASNFWFGVFMGSTASIGLFIGLDLDIRHITFASGNLALGLYGNDFHLDHWILLWSILGVGMIGFVNFSVSFILSLTLALRSRMISWKEVIPLFGSVWAHFKSNPLSFFIPIRTRK
jgi:site-specific recombinase